MHLKLTTEYWIGLRYAQACGVFTADRQQPHLGRHYIPITSPEDHCELNLSVSWDDWYNQSNLKGSDSSEHGQQEEFLKEDIGLLTWIGANGDEQIKDPRKLLAFAAAKANPRADDSFSYVTTDQPEQAQREPDAASVEG